MIQRYGYPLAVIGLACALSAILFSRGLTALGGDFGWHFALTRFSMKHLNVDAEMSVINALNYPRLPHLIAGIIGEYFGPTRGLMIVCVMSIAAIYTALFLIVSRIGLFAALGAATVLIALSASNYTGKLFGREIVQNFFVGQIFAEAIFWTWLLCLVLRPKADAWFGTFTLVMFFLAASSHLVPALRIPVVYGLFLLFPVSWKALFRAGMFGAAGLAILYLHPNVRGMYANSAHEGSLHFGFAFTPGQAIGIAAALGIVSAVLWWKQPNTAAKLLGIAGFAVASLALVQLLLFQFGLGSNYAGRKHFFAVFTLLPVILVVLSSLLISPRSAQFSPSLAAMLFGVLMTATVLRDATVISAATVDYFGKIAASYKQAKPQARWISISKSLPGPVNGAIMLAEFGQTMGLDFLDVQNSRWPSRLKDFNFALVDRVDERFPGHCTLYAADIYRAVDLACVTKLD